MRDYNKYFVIIIILLIVVSFIAFGRIVENDFINFDDDQYITKNNHIQSGINTKSIHWALTAVVMGNWHPITLLSHMLDWKLFGVDASGHHLMNLLLHVGAVLFLFLFLNKATKNLWAAAFAAAFFALHPLRVESIAWASERKDVLSMFFGMATLYAYIFYYELPKPSRYIICLTLYALALMSKPMLVTLPLLLMLLDYWPLQRWQSSFDGKGKEINSVSGLVREKIPFIALAILSGIVTFWAQNKAGATSFGEGLPFLMRSANAVISYIDYLGKILWPLNLAVFYPYGWSLSLWKVLIDAIFIITITILVLCYIKKLPFLFVGWFWYLGTLVPVIGLMQVGSQAMADRYTYLPSIGLCMMLVWGISSFFYREDVRKIILFPMGLAAATILSFLTWQQCGYWKNSVTLFNHAVHVTKDNYLAHQYFGMALYDEGRLKEAVDHYNTAILLKPGYAEVYINRGITYTKLGQYQVAIKDYNKAIRLKPTNVEAYINRGNAYNQLGEYRRAIEDYNEAIRQKPDYAEAYNNRGFSHSQSGAYNLAIADFNKAIGIMPSSASAYFNRGVIYAKLGQYQRAIEDYNAAIRYKPDYSSAYYNRGILYGGRGQYNLALDDFSRVIDLKPDFADVYNNRGFTYSNLGEYQRAIEDYNKAIGLKSDDVNFYMNRGVAYLKKGNYILGCRDIKKACASGKCATLKSAQTIGLCR